MKSQAIVPLGALAGLLWLDVRLNLEAHVPQLLHYQGRPIATGQMWLRTDF